ncbi:Uncharacterised protein [Phocoenobacter uteri]|uniref:Transferrin-binding protein B C-lobe/N-lobe beta barrel domain-containing protein n=1 Tax=Phocoenobacter uteri TaxID=146806 RepID=A0A379CBT2_9PAST|nr:hypothetical protein [Phocoenobacter uteri]MDG6881805.1 hypothetical protein [Phocoenobacter uteri]SUB59842.1 Uncharacterised protein [Phocoenobacter uteri]
MKKIILLSLLSLCLASCSSSGGSEGGGTVAGDLRSQVLKDVQNKYGSSIKILSDSSQNYYNYSLYGVIGNNKMVSYGFRTSKMDNEGIATYNGEFVKVSNGQKYPLRATADFGKAHIDMVYNNDKYMSGRISGNAFIFDQGNGTGFFYGPKAQEIGGYWTKKGVLLDSNYVFGGKR